jgi:hypothetical protein
MYNSMDAIIDGFSKDRMGSFLSGYTSAFNLCGDIDFPDVSRGLERDAAALRKDWYKVGSDMSRAMERVDCE